MKNMDFNERYETLAKNLFDGTRLWYLNPFSQLFFACPLNAKNMDEMGGGFHIFADEQLVRKLLSEGELINSPMVKEILIILDNLYKKNADI